MESQLTLNVVAVNLITGTIAIGMIAFGQLMCFNY